MTMAEQKTEEEAKVKETTAKEDKINVESDDDDAEGEEPGSASTSDVDESKQPDGAAAAAAATATSKKKKTTASNWPMRDIKDPHANDVLYGRGGGTNHHPGNKRYRKMVEDRKLDYVNSKRLDKPLVALDIIRQWRSQDPPGRFLKLDEKTGLWHDVGDKKAREKTSQALREKAPLIRKQQEEEKLGKSNDEDGDKPPEDDADQAVKTTRFAEGTNEEKKGVKKAVLARDHSLGREYLPFGEAVTIDGFSWQEPIEDIGGSYTPERLNSQGSLSPPPPPHSYAAGRTGSHGSIGVPPPEYRTQSQSSMGPPEYRTQSQSSMGGPPPPPRDYYGHMQGGEHRRAYSGNFETWGPMSSMGSTTMPPMPGYGAPPYHQRSGSWTMRDVSMHREHSLSGNILRDASISHAAPYGAFDSRTGSGYWEGHPMHSGHMPPHPPPPPHGPPHRSHGPSPVPHGPPPPPPPPPTHGPSPPPHVMAPPPHAAPPHPSMYPPREGPPPFRTSNGPSPYPRNSSSAHPYHHPSSTGSPVYDVDPIIAKTWSGGQEIKRSGSEDNYGRVPPESLDQLGSKPSFDGYDESGMPRPSIVKRATSNQNETLETKKDLKGPSVKRAALNRDNSLASNRLKEKYVPGYHEIRAKESFDHEKEMNILSDNLEQSTLSTALQPRPKPLRAEERISTLDHIAMDLMVRPLPLLEVNRSSTIDALDLQLEDDPVLQPLQRSSTSETELGLLKPLALSSESRSTTMDFLQIINEPLGDEVDESPSLDIPLEFKSESNASEWLAKA